MLAAPDEHEKFPRLIVLNPGKRKRILAHDDEINEGSITKTLDKILAGDAKFKVVKGNALPDLVSEYIEWMNDQLSNSITIEQEWHALKLITQIEINFYSNI